MSIGDFGSVNACIHYEIFKRKDGYFCSIFSCIVLLFTANGVELMHRLTAYKIEEIEQYLAGEIKREEDEEYGY